MMILLIDNYDSFTYNLYQLIGSFNPNIVVKRNDEIACEEIEQMNPDKIIISPGPKTPDEAGNCIDIIRQFAEKIPILGVCLGHQCIGQAFGGMVSYAKELFHGKKSLIHHNGEGLFKDMPNPFVACRYHSLMLDKKSLPNDFRITALTEDGEIMAISHKSKMVYGLQFHPESIYTPEGYKIIKNFLCITNRKEDF